MKNLLSILAFLCIFISFAQEVEEEFIPIEVEDKEAFISTKTGEYIFRAHANTNPEELSTTPSGVIYNDISYHNVTKGETLSSISKKHNISIEQLKKDNKLKSNALSLNQKIKIVNRILVPSSSPVISYVGEERIIARLPVGESPATLPPPPPPAPTTREVKQAPKTNSYSKPMVIPQTTTNNLAEEVVVEEDDTDEIIAAKKQLEEARKQLELAKQKATKKEVDLEDVSEDAEDLVEDEKEEVEDKEEEVTVSNKKPSVDKDKLELVDDTTETPNYHVIVKGDNLYNLSKKYKISVEDLIKLNDVDFKNLKIGQKLKLK